MGSPLGGLPRTPLQMNGDANPLTPAWAGWLTIAGKILQDISNSGTTAQRPTTFLYIGKRYFDTTLGVPIALKSVGPAVWVNGVGTVV